MFRQPDTPLMADDLAQRHRTRRGLPRQVTFRREQREEPERES